MANEETIEFRYAAGGVLVCDVPIEGVTQDLTEDRKFSKELMEFYGARYFVAESMTKGAAKRLAELLGGKLAES
jgi:hypothetical protein